MKKNRLKEDGCCSCHPRKLLQLSTEESVLGSSPRTNFCPFPPRVLIIPSIHDHVQLLQPSLKTSSWAHSLPNLLYWARWVWAYSLNSKSTQTLTLHIYIYISIESNFFIIYYVNFIYYCINQVNFFGMLVDFINSDRVYCLEVA